MAELYRGGTGQSGSAMKDKAGELLGDVKSSARAQLDEQQRAAASGLGDFAGALRNAARQTKGGQGNGTAARFAESAADGLERLSGTLRNKDFDSAVRDAESFARREPILFFGAAVAAGFLAIRFLKSSSADSSPAASAGATTTTTTPSTPTTPRDPALATTPDLTRSY